MLPISPRIRTSARYVCGLARLYELCLHGQQEIAVEGQSISNRSDEQGLNGSKVRHLHVGDRIIQRNSLAQCKACRCKNLPCVGGEVRPTDFLVISAVCVSLHHVSGMN